MSALLREIQAADFLGYTESIDFRAAVRAGEVPGPCRKIRQGRRSVDVWSRRELEEWIDSQGGGQVNRPSLRQAIKEYA